MSNYKVKIEQKETRDGMTYKYELEVNAENKSQAKKIAKDMASGSKYTKIKIYKVSDLRFDVVKGFNTKQLWVYENENNVFIDPPKEVLDEIDKLEEEEQEDKLFEIVKTNPSWLYDFDYWYSGEIDI